MFVGANLVYFGLYKADPLVCCTHFKEPPLALDAPSRGTTILLDAIRRDDSGSAWAELDRRCRPIMLGVARRMGLKESHAEDAAQGGMISLLGVIRSGRFDRSRGSLRALCLTIIRSQVIDLRRKQCRAREEPHNGQAAGREEPCERVLERLWLNERREQILRQALDELRKGGTDERTIHAFELYGIREMDPGQVGAMLGMTRDEVYVAKLRVAKRLRPIVARLDEMYEDL